jgi:hypothetical protein
MYTQHSVNFYANIFCQRILSHEVQIPTQCYFSLNTIIRDRTSYLFHPPSQKKGGDVQSVSLISESNIRTSQVVYYSKRQLQ